MHYQSYKNAPIVITITTTTTGSCTTTASTVGRSDESTERRSSPASILQLLCLRSGVSKSRYFARSIAIKYSNFSRFYKKRVHFIKNSDVINFVIDQSQPGVFYLKKNDEFHETRGLLP